MQRSVAFSSGEKDKRDLQAIWHDPSWAIHSRTLYLLSSWVTVICFPLPIRRGAFDETDKILGVETHSLCKEDAWRSARTAVKRLDMFHLPVLFTVSSDGFSNSFISEDEFLKNNRGYYDLIREHGTASIAPHLSKWLSETSEQGCGDDITVGLASGLERYA